MRYQLLRYYDRYELGRFESWSVAFDRACQDYEGRLEWYLPPLDSVRFLVDSRYTPKHPTGDLEAFTAFMVIDTEAPEDSDTFDEDPPIPI